MNKCFPVERQDYYEYSILSRDNIIEVLDRLTSLDIYPVSLVKLAGRFYFEKILGPFFTDHEYLSNSRLSEGDYIIFNRESGKVEFMNKNVFHQKYIEL